MKNQFYGDYERLMDHGNKRFDRMMKLKMQAIEYVHSKQINNIQNN